MDVEVTTTDDLKQSYAAVMENADWQTDGPDGPVQPHGFTTPVVAVSSKNGDELPPDPLRIVEALLFVGGQPLRAERACEIVRGLSSEQFSEAVDTLNHAYRQQGRPYAILAQDHGYRLTLRPRFLQVVDKVYGGPREARLSTAAIDVLALVAYRQPVAKVDIDSLRGAESGSLLRQLVRRGLVQVSHSCNGNGKPDTETRGQEGRETEGEKAHREVLYSTTERFLHMFGLANLEDLPHTQDPQQM